MIELPLVVVYGRWPRSGTTLLTRVLDAGGAPAIRDLDGGHAPDWASQAALVSPVRTLCDVGTRSTVKLWTPQLLALLDAGYRPAAVVTPVRRWDESNTSWHTQGWADDLRPGVALVEKWTAAIGELVAAGTRDHTVGFHELIDDPMKECGRLARLLGGDWDVPAMAAVPDPACRHHGQRQPV